MVGTEELGPLFVHPAAPGLLWIVAALFALPAVAIALVGLLRGRLPPVAALAGLVLLPIFAFLLGNLVLMERSKGVEFCGSCHATMSPLVASLSEENGSLAAIHYMNGSVSHSEGCYSCHSGYGIWGDAGAKMAGVQHMLHTVTGNYEFPLTHYGAFDIDSCLVCHAETQAFRAVESHRNPDIQSLLVSREMACTGACHPAAHPPEALNGAEAYR